MLEKNSNEIANMDFENDLKLEIINISKEMGFKISTNQNLNKVLLDTPCSA